MTLWSRVIGIFSREIKEDIIVSTSSTTYSGKYLFHPVIKVHSLDDLERDKDLSPLAPKVGIPVRRMREYTISYASISFEEDKS